MAARKFPPQGNKKSNDLALINRRRQIAFLYLQGTPQIEIAARFEVSQPVISEELKKIREAWKTEFALAIEERKAQECAKLDALEAIAWQAWERSCKDGETRKKSRDDELRAVTINQAGKKVMTEKMTPVREHLEIVTKGQAGDSRFLDRVAWCIEMRMKVFGMLKEDKKQVNVMNINWDSLIKPTEDMEVTDADDPIERRIMAIEAGEAVNA